jgi:transposase
MASAYSLDFREKVVGAYRRGEGSYRKLAQRFCIGEATVKRWVSRWKKTGSLEPGVRGGLRRPRLIDSKGEKFITQRLRAVPDHTLLELCIAYEAKFGVRPSTTTMSKTLKRMGYTKKKVPLEQRLHFEMTW